MQMTMQGNENDNARQCREKSMQIMALDCGVSSWQSRKWKLIPERQEGEVEILEVKQRQSLPSKCALH